MESLRRLLSMRRKLPNKSLQATPINSIASRQRDGGFSSGWLPKPATRWMPQMDCSLRELWSRFTLVGPACLTLGI
jgi:hypothetical protein